MRAVPVLAIGSPKVETLIYFPFYLTSIKLNCLLALQAARVLTHRRDREGPAPQRTVQSRPRRGIPERCPD